METVLTLSIGGMPPMSARGCVQELRPVPQGTFKRTINGDLVFIGHKEHKYFSIIKCKDSVPIATEGLQVGTELYVGCIQPLCQKIEKFENTIVLERDFVEGSIQIFDEDNNEINDFEITGRTIKINHIEKNSFVSYSPKLLMKVISFTLTTDEWNLSSSWQLELEEV